MQELITLKLGRYVDLFTLEISCFPCVIHLTKATFHENKSSNLNTRKINVQCHVQLFIEHTVFV